MQINTSWRIALIALLILLLFPRSAHACSCAPNDDIPAALDLAAAVFRATMVDSFTNQLLNPAFLSRKVEFEVHEVWKGDVPQFVSVYTGSGGGDCGYGFQDMGEHLIYAYEAEVGLATSICERTAQIGDAAEDLGVLGTGYAPIPVANGIVGRAAPYVIGVAIWLLIAGYLVWRRRSAKVIVPLLVLFFVVGCGGSGRSDVYIGRLRTNPHAGDEALLEGNLVVQDGCLQVQTEWQDDPVMVVWPSRFTLQGQDGQYELLEDGAVVGNVGDTISLGGSYSATDGITLIVGLIEPIPDGCVTVEIFRANSRIEK